MSARPSQTTLLNRQRRGNPVSTASPLSMITRVLHWWAMPAQRYLRWAVLFSVTFHLLVVFVRIGTAPRAKPPASNLEVVMVNAQSENAPVQPQVIAQSNLDGGGESTEGIATNPRPLSENDIQELELQALIRQRMQLEEEQRQLLEQLKAKDRANAGKPSPYFLDQAIQPGRDEADQQPIQSASATAAIAERVNQYNARPRRQFTAPSAVANRDAAYVDAWRKRVELTGTQHYPKGVGKQLEGKLQASVTIRADGTVVNVELDKPSSEPLLNQAVRRIIQLASPFAPFSPEMRKQIDEITITRTWHFVHGSLQTTP